MKELFRPHGASEINIDGNIICIEAEGPWNAEFFNMFHQELMVAAKDLDINNFATLLLPVGEALGVQEGFESHMAFVERSNTRGLAICLKHSTIPTLSKQMCQKMYDQIDVNYRFFDEPEEAKAWLLSLLD